MTTPNLLEDLRRAGHRVTIEGPNLRVVPTPTADLLVRVRAQKAALIAQLRAEDAWEPSAFDLKVAEWSASVLWPLDLCSGCYWCDMRKRDKSKGFVPPKEWSEK